MLNIRKNKSGISIIEALVAISVVTIGLLGLTSLVVQNIKVRKINRTHLISSMLAQEGLELTRNIRDTNWLELILDSSLPVDHWKDELSTGGTTTFTIDYNSPPDSSVNNITDNGARLFLNGDFYDHTAGNSTEFRRLITVVDNGHYLAVSVAVSIGPNASPYVAETYLYNWR